MKVNASWNGFKNMDLEAYMKIEELEKVAKDNGIEKDAEIYIVERLCESEEFWNPNCTVICLCK